MRAHHTSQVAQTSGVARKLARTYAAVFLVAICLPVVRLAVGGSTSGADRELRRAEDFPKLSADPVSWASFARGFTRWYADHFGYRSELLHQNSLVKWIGLASSPSEDVICGRDDWVFFKGNGTLDQARGRRPFEPGQIDAWLAMLEQRRAWLAERGCDYLFVVAPSKASVYPDYLPAGHESVGPSRLDQLFEALTERSEVPSLDLRQALIEERANDRGGDWTYYPLGTHWTWRGALRGWREIVAAVPEVFDAAPPALETIPRTLRPDKQGDSWGSRLYIEDQLRQEVWAMRVPDPRSAEKLDYGWHGTRYAALDDGFQGPRVMLFHDSFGTALKGFLARSCAPLTCFWTANWEAAWIDAEGPDLVIDLFVERTLMGWKPAAMELETQGVLGAAFEIAPTPLWAITEDEPASVWESRSKSLHARGAHVGDGVEVRGVQPRGAKGFVRLPDLSGKVGEECLIALDVESEQGGMLHIKLGARDRRQKDLAWAFAQPGRQTLFFCLRLPSESREIWLRSSKAGWTLFGMEARRASAP